MTRKIRYSVRHSNGKTWACDRITSLGTRFYTKDYTRYFKTKEEAEAYKERMEIEE
jgi:hypothetical protein